MEDKKVVLKQMHDTYQIEHLTLQISFVVWHQEGWVETLHVAAVYKKTEQAL